MAHVLLNKGIMNYFECIKCGASFVYNGNHTPDRCGAFVGIKTVEARSPLGYAYDVEIAAGCGGKMVKITKEAADKKVENIRRKTNV